MRSFPTPGLSARKHIAALLIIMFSASFSFPLSAHRHQRDTVIINGAGCTTGIHPLGQLDSLHYRHLADELDFKNCTSSWNWNGYIATMSVDGDKLYLTELSTYDNKKHFYDPKDYLKDYVDNSGKVLASWFSGVLECAKGEILYYAPDGIHDICESTIKLTIESGAVVGYQEFVNIKHKGRNELRDLSEGIKTFPGEKFSRTARVLVTPIPARVAADGTVRKWNFKLYTRTALAPGTEKKLIRELNRMLLKYDFDTYRDCGNWLLSPRNINFTVVIGKPSGN